MTDATDDFNRANGSLGTNWVDSTTLTGLTIVSNQANSAGATWKAAYWNPATNTFANDQHSQITLVGDFAGAIVRHQSGSSSGYLAFANIGTGQILLYRLDSGTFNLLTTSASGLGFGPGDTITADIVGTTLRGLLNGVSQVSTVEATYSSGQPGIAANNTSLDNFAGGPTSGTTTLMGAMWQ